MHSPTVRDVIDIINRIAPFDMAEKWDNSGLQTGHPDWPVKGVMVALDVTSEALEAAWTAGCTLLVTHHPLFMGFEKSIDFSTMSGKLIHTSAIREIAVVSAHTNLDKAQEGLNDCFAQQIGIDCNAPLLIDSDSTQDAPVGIGRVGTIKTPMSLGDYAREIKHCLKIPQVRVIGDPLRNVAMAALCTGSGGSLTPQFLDSDADVYITGDLKYHEARDIEAAGKACIDVGHFASEHIVVDMLTSRLEKEFKLHTFEVDIFGYHSEKDPFRII